MPSDVLLEQVRRLEPQNVHPGLQLDKYTRPEKQAEGKAALARVAGIAAKQGPDSAREALAGARARREALLAALGARCITAAARTPLTMHLARTAALENAGIALHRVGGFPYLPGTGVKGMARAYAELVARGTDDDVGRVFGRRLPPGEREGAAAGTVVFHDAWPIEWPALVVDITNSHHPEYYKTSGGEPPGDWDSPKPVYFLAVAAGAKFEFAVSPRDSSVSVRDLDLAAEWLRGALAHLGVGAKTAAGYGWMQVENAPQQTRGTIVRHELELVTPAFLAGAAQGADDCTLRPSTLRGLLRWWWRTMHVGYLESKELYALEGVIFGSTAEGQSAFDLVVTPASQSRPAVPLYKDRPFQDAHGVRPRTKEKDGRRKKLGTGVAYVAYGMADGQRAPRHALEAGARWALEFRVHPDRRITADKHLLRGRTVSMTLVQSEVESALFLLCHFGAVGAKARKGFGSVATPSALAGLGLAAVRGRAAETRKALGFDRPFDARWVDGACSVDLLARLGGNPPFVEVTTPWTDPWTAMDRVGQVLQDGAADWAHKEEKAALGLPRAIHGPRPEPMDHQDPATHQRQIRLEGRAVRLDRHASPVHVSLDHAPSGELVVRVLAFVAGRLAAPPPATPEKSRAFLEPYLTRLEQRLRDLASSGAPAGHGPRGGGLGRGAGPRPGGQGGGGRPGFRDERPGREPGGRPAPAPTYPAGVRSGDPVEVELIEAKTAKGGWKAKLVAPPHHVGHFENWKEIPPEAAAGQRVTAILKSVPASGDWTFLWKKG